MNRQIQKLMKERTPLDERCSIANPDDGSIHVCSRADKPFCGVFVFPDKKWGRGDCPMADEPLRTKDAKKKASKIRVGQQKQKKSST